MRTCTCPRCDVLAWCSVFSIASFVASPAEALALLLNLAVASLLPPCLPTTSASAPRVTANPGLETPKRNPRVQSSFPSPTASFQLLFSRPPTDLTPTLMAVFSIMEASFPPMYKLVWPASSLCFSVETKQAQPKAEFTSSCILSASLNFYEIRLMTY